MVGVLTEHDCEKIYKKNFDHLVIEPLLNGLANDYKVFSDIKLQKKRIELPLPANFDH